MSLHFRETIQAYKVELLLQANGSSIDRQHYVVFAEDNDKLWFNLQVEEEAGRLSWQESRDNDNDAAASMAMMPEPTRSAAATTNPVVTPERHRHRRRRADVPRKRTKKES